MSSAEKDAGVLAEGLGAGHRPLPVRSELNTVATKAQLGMMNELMDASDGLIDELLDIVDVEKHRGLRQSVNNYSRRYRDAARALALLRKELARVSGDKTLAK